MTTPPDSTYPSEPLLSKPVEAPTSSEKVALNPENPPWGVPAAVITWGMSIVLLLLIPQIVTLPYVAERYKATTKITRDLLLTDRTFVFLYVLGFLPAHLLTLALVWAIATRLGKYSIREVFGWSWSENFGLLTAVALAVLLFSAAWLLTAILGGQKTDLDQILESSRAAALMLAFIAVATAPLVEEMIYRGLLYSALQRLVGQWAGVFIVASMFAGLHVVQYWPNVGAISSITMLSLVLTIIRARTGRLLPCFVIHLIFNGIQSVIIVIEPYLRAYLERSTPGHQGSLVIYVAGLVLGS